jgi:dTDP-4-dehydrorhamnose reductase
VNATAYTFADLAQTHDGRKKAWAVNALAVSRIARACAEHFVPLIHYSSDYVFDGTLGGHYAENEPLSPLGGYGQSKAAGDLAAQGNPAHYLLRVSWVIGNGENFVNTMRRLARDGVNPDVVNDQVGRPTFAEDIAAATLHLLDTNAPYGTYNFTNSGPVVSWAEIAKETFTLAGAEADRVSPVTTQEYAVGKPTFAPRPANSALSLDKIESTGFIPRDWHEALTSFITTTSITPPAGR